MKTRRLSPDEALDFLERGFSESGVRCPGDLISSLRSPRYAVILRALAGGRAPWAAIRRRLEDYEGRGLNPATVSQLIGTLVKLGVVEEVNGEYAIADPVYRLAASRL